MSRPSEPSPREPDASEPRRLADHLKLYLSEPTLWPVTLVGGVILSTLGIAALVLALERNLAALGAVALLAGLSVDQCVREARSGGPGAVTALVGGFWLLSAAGALLLRSQGWV